MKDEQIKEMLNGIINNGEKWECRPDYKKCLYGTKNNPWQPYRLGDEIYNDWEYRKIEAHNSKIDIENVCKKILEEVKRKIAEKQMLGFTFSNIDNEELKGIIKDLGVEV